MIDSLLDRATSVLERRFLTNAFLPVLLLAPAAAMPSLVQDRRLDDLTAKWDPLPVATKVFIVVGYFTFSWFAAVIVASQWRNIIRLYEGYPLERWSRLYEAGRRWHSAIAEDHERRENWYAEYESYPAADEALPTRLGNVMRAAERYPVYRYDADVVLVWPRLQQILPRDAVLDVEDARATLEFLLVLSLWCVSFAALVPVVAYVEESSPVVALLCCVAGGGGAYAAYLSAIGAAAEYGEQLRAVFDVYRLDLLQRLRVPTPRNHTDEQARWRALGAFIGRGDPPEWTYDPGVVEPPDPSTDIESRRDRDRSI